MKCSSISINMHALVTCLLNGIGVLSHSQNNTEFIWAVLCRHETSDRWFIYSKHRKLALDQAPTIQSCRCVCICLLPILMVNRWQVPFTFTSHYSFSQFQKTFHFLLTFTDTDHRTPPLHYAMQTHARTSAKNSLVHLSQAQNDGMEYLKWERKDDKRIRPTIGSLHTRNQNSHIKYYSYIILVNHKILLAFQ